jgi:predicted PurR-regulated permease PerM
MLGSAVGEEAVGTNWDTQRIALAALVAAVAFFAVWMLWHFLPALAWAVVLAIATWPLRTRFAHQGMGKTAIAACLTIIVAVVLVLPLIGCGVELAREGETVVRWLRDIRLHGLGTPDWMSHLPYGTALAAWWQANLAQPEAAHALFGRAEANGVFSYTRTLGVEVANRLTILVFTILALFFLYRDGPRFVEQARTMSDRLFGVTGWRLGQGAVAAIRGTVNGLVLVGLFEGVSLGFAYAATGLSHATVLGLLTAVFATVPFGAALIFVLCALALFVQSHSTAAIVLLVFGSLVVGLADHILRPILIGSSTRLPFLWVLLGIFGGFESFGLIGLFLGPAIMSVLIAIWREGATPFTV